MVPTELSPIDLVQDRVVRNRELGHRLYFALRPDLHTARSIVRMGQDLARRRGLAGRITPAERLHVSMEFVQGGQALASDETAAILAPVVRDLDMPPFRVTFNRVVSWKGRPESRPLVLIGDEGVIGIELLRTALRSRLADAGRCPVDRPFWPHMTLMWRGHEDVDETVEPISWTAREFTLVESATGAGQRLLARWRLPAGS